MLVCCGSLFACGGKNGAVAPIPQSSNAVTASALGRFSFEIPRRSSQISSSDRKTQYVSSATQSISLTLTTVNGATPSPAPAAQIVNVSSSTNGCGADPHNAGDVLCTVAMTLPVGNDALTIATYDANGATGDLLSQQRYAAAVSAGAANVFSFTLDANPADAEIGVSSPGGAVEGNQSSGFTIPAGASAQNFTLSLTDAAGQTVVGPGAPSPSATSANGSVASVSLSGNTLTIAPVGVGSTHLTVGEAPANTQGGNDGLSAGGASFNVLVAPAGESAYPNGTPQAIPGTISFSNYDVGGQGVAYNTPYNSTNPNGATYRPNEGVGVETDVDTGYGNGYDVGYNQMGSWY